MQNSKFHFVDFYFENIKIQNFKLFMKIPKFQNFKILKSKFVPNTEANEILRGAKYEQSET